MEPEIILVIVFLVTLAIIRIRSGKYEFALCARIGMSAMLFVTAIGHFLFSEGMAMIIPGFIPFRIELIYATGLIEILAAIGLHLGRHRRLTGWLLIVFFIMLLPANIYEAIKHVDIEKATFEGNGTGYLWYRIPLQILFIIWVYLSSIKASGSKTKSAVAYIPSDDKETIRS